MGCVKSKQTFPFSTPFEPEKQHENEENLMPSSVTVKNEVKQPSGTSTVVLEYAQRLSQEILCDALNQWAFNNVMYYDIPYIEYEGPDAAE
ncbi:PREDICTED: small membrane A-kinase anchor protein [Propithecus coquereli]|uniref:small membrane A-kinase anchor protein n=1 Tax=Propithecus coquereli TaxID=379532 RepID=UPI00063F47ED|nr:PREDICTED: small membrane A-kinase anchor protein [Propithecus coquereli]XP_012503384.1 PREDICTED: small membrane A-kinase anchor protein [Propithecus coquereli]